MPDSSPIETQTSFSSPETFGPARRHGAPWWLTFITLGLLITLATLQQIGGSNPDPDAPAKAAKGMNDVKAPHTGELIIFGKIALGMQDWVKQMAVAAGAPTSPAASPPATPAVPPASPSSPSTPPADGSAAAPSSGAPSPSTATATLSSDEVNKSFLTFVNQAAGWEPETKTFWTPAVVDKNHPPKANDKPHSAATRLRATILAGELAPPDELEWRLADIEKTLAPESPLVQDVKSVRILYAVPDKDGKKPAETDLDPVSRAGLEKRHGWFADLALSHGHDDAPVRKAAADDGVRLLVVLALFGLLVVLAALTGIVLLIIALVNSNRLRRAFAPPSRAREWPVEPATAVLDQHGLPVPAALVPQRGGAIWLETFCVFLLAFLTLKLVSTAVAKAAGDQDWVIWVPLTLQWAILPTIFWPVLRGMSWERWRGEIGWHKGRGVGREVLAGIGGYLATVPIYICAAFIVVVLILIVSLFTGKEPNPGDTNRVSEVFGSGNLPEMIVLGLLATVWAPIVEESIFRGAVFRHLRRRAGLFLSALLSAGAFAVLHPYPWFGWIMVGVLGFCFAIMREWRSSLIPSAVAHALHNGVITILMAIVFSLAAV